MHSERVFEVIDVADEDFVEDGAFEGSEGEFDGNGLFGLDIALVGLEGVFYVFEEGLVPTEVGADVAPVGEHDVLFVVLEYFVLFSEVEFGEFERVAVQTYINFLNFCVDFQDVRGAVDDLEFEVVLEYLGVVTG